MFEYTTDAISFDFEKILLKNNNGILFMYDIQTQLLTSASFSNIYRL